MDLAAELARYGPAARPTAVTLAQAQDYCRRLALGHYENFTVVSRLFPSHLQQHLCNVYAYCRWADDLADENPLPRGEGGLPLGRPGEGQYSPIHLLDWWEQQLDAMFAGETSHPVFVALAETASTYNLPREPFADLLVAFRRDQTQTRYETLAELLTYCDKSANPVGRIVLRLGRAFDAQNAGLSDSICTGLQLANFWQDVKRDFDRGRIYLPQELCRQHGWTDDRFAVGQCDESFREMLRGLVDDAEARLQAGERLTGRVGADLRPSLRAFVGGGLAILAAIRRCRYDVWTRRPTVGPLTKLRLVAQAWWGG